MKMPLPASDNVMNTNEAQARYRAQATGIGQSQAMSRQSGMARSQRVIDSAPTDVLKMATGYPAPMPRDDGNGMRDLQSGQWASAYTSSRGC